MSEGDALATWEAQAELDGIFGDVARMESRDAHVRWIAVFATSMAELGIRARPSMLIGLGSALVVTHGERNPLHVAREGFHVNNLASTPPGQRPAGAGEAKGQP